MLRRHSRPLVLSLLILFFVVAPVIAASGPDIALSIAHTGNTGTNNNDFSIGGSGSVTVDVANIGDTDTTGNTVVTLSLDGGLTASTLSPDPTLPDGLFTDANCTGFNTSTVTCTATNSVVAGSTETLTFNVSAHNTTGTNFQNHVSATNASDIDNTNNTNIADPTTFSVAAGTVNLKITSETHNGNFNSGGDFTVGGQGTVTVVIQNQGTIASSGQATLNILLDSLLTFIAQSRGSLFTNCAPNGTQGGKNVVTCTTVAAIGAGATDTITVAVRAASTAGFARENRANIVGGGDTTIFNYVGPDLFNVYPLGTQTATAFPTFPIATFTGVPTLPVPTLVPTATFIPPPATGTPLPRPANAGQAVGPVPHPDVTIVVDRDGVNVRSIPAIGAPVIATVNAGFSTNILGRSGDGQWVQVKVAGQLGWIGTAVLAIVNGDINSAPVNDPLTIPYGGWENPRAGLTSVTSQYTGKLDNSGLRVRSGPGAAYVVLANAPRYTIFSLLGRTDDNMWLQVNFDGTLGWVAADFVDLQQGLGVFNSLPVDGIVADALPVSSAGADSYNDTLKLMLARIDLAQPSLDSIRSTWTTIALGNRAACSNFPARPSDLSIPNPILAASYPTLFPLDTDFNNAMASLRNAIDLFITICGQPQPPNGFVGQPVVQTALDAVNATDALFSSLRQRLKALLPAQGPINNDTQCLFSYQDRSQVVPRLKVNEAQIVHMTRHDFILGFCFDGGAGQSLKLEVLKINGNAEPQITVSAFSNATNFLGTAQISGTTTDVSIAPILITQTDRYIAIMADLDGAPSGDLQGDFAILLTDVTGNGGLGGASLGFDANGNVIINQGGITPATPGLGGGLTPGVNGLPGIGTPGENLGGGGPTATPIPIGG